MGPQDGRLGPAYTEPLALSTSSADLTPEDTQTCRDQKPWKPLENLWESYGKVAEHIWKPYFFSWETIFFNLYHILHL